MVLGEGGCFRSKLILKRNVLTSKTPLTGQEILFSFSFMLRKCKIGYCLVILLPIFQMADGSSPRICSGQSGNPGNLQIA